MNHNLHSTSVEATISTPHSVAVFLKASEKTFMIQVDPQSGNSIKEYQNGVTHSRPMPHNLFASLVEGVGGEIKKLIIHDVSEEVYLATLRIECSDASERKLIIDLDCRPSDGIALSFLLKFPIYCTDQLLSKTVDSSKILRELQQSDDICLSPHQKIFNDEATTTEYSSQDHDLPQVKANQKTIDEYFAWVIDQMFQSNIDLSASDEIDEEKVDDEGDGQNPSPPPDDLDPK